MSEEKDLPTKRKYQMLLWGQILLVTIYNWHFFITGIAG